jgi:hypothetical protein
LGSFVRISGSRTATIEVSFNHLVGAGEKRRRHIRYGAPITAGGDER